MNFSTNELVALLIATSFAAGLNVYATVATLGLLAHSGALPLPDSLHLLANWWIIAASGFLFVIEFFVDKIPAFDLIWNALQTFVRIPVAALLAYGATSHLSPGKQLLATAMGGTIAFASHSGKMAARAAVTPSPEPLSNITLSLGEDAAAISLTWLATQHPYWAAAAVLIALIIIIVMLRWVTKTIRSMFRRTKQALSDPSQETRNTEL
ncbi:MAG: hypothetical protein NVS1B11_28270 [Terriglobales bacterium]